MTSPGTSNENAEKLQPIKAVKATKTLKALSRNNIHSLLTPLRAINLQECVPEIPAQSLSVIYLDGDFVRFKTAAEQRLGISSMGHVSITMLNLFCCLTGEKKHFNESRCIQISAVFKYYALCVSIEHFLHLQKIHNTLLVCRLSSSVASRRHTQRYATERHF